MFKFWFHNCQQGEGQAQADSIWQLREFNFLVVVLRISFVLVLLEARGKRGSARQLDATPTWKLQRQAANWRSVVCATYQCTRTNEKSCKFRKVKETLSNCCWCPPCFCGPPDSHGQVTKFAAKSCACGIEIDAPSKGTIKKWDEDERPHQLQSSEIGNWFNLQCIASSKWLTTQGWNQRCGRNRVRSVMDVRKIGQQPQWKLY